MSYYKKLKADLAGAASAGISISPGVMLVAARNRDKAGHGRGLMLLDLAKKI
jgi:hypothetical protein